ncbi:hypothetical protein CY34DRAFT_709408 [Suillus luteus UH-Slu-Lm8-n1]|uniref:Uncharacterized protein n=1 Tax=Suillus luteus UH-Slu-Lm8-n1 TaxID=930992 RepID=A0A0D0ANP4_9AGAM|nr:hypothetical protein CY34DRAFT_709408 [Suillus luteus UH-Slu-Lm8-n1]
MEQLNSSNAQRGPSSLALLPLSKFLQYGTNSRWLLPAGPNVTRRHKYSNSNFNRSARDHLQYPMLQPLMLTHHRAQELPIHDLDACWLISCSFFVAHPLNVLVPVHNQHSIIYKAKRRPNPRLRRHHNRLNLPPPPHARHLLLLMPKLPCPVQQTCSPAPCHCGPVSFFFSAVHPSHMQTDTSTASLARSSQFGIWYFVIVVIVNVQCVYLILQLPQYRARFNAVVKPPFFPSSRYKHVWLQIMMLHSP